MTKSGSGTVPQGAAGEKGRASRRAARGRRAAWVRPFRRARRALEASLRLVDTTWLALSDSHRCMWRRPLLATRKLDNASGLLVTATARLQRAAERLAEVTACVARQPESAAGVPQLLEDATERFLYVADSLTGAASQVFNLQDSLIEDLLSGKLVPEPPAPRRPRIVLAPRPAPIRAFLRARQPRVADRISPLLQRRRRTRLPAAIRVPRRTAQGRAPPLVPVCLL